MRRFIWPLIIIFSSMVAGLLAASSYNAPIRMLFSFWFLLVCPGMAFSRLFRFKEKLAEWVVAIALSIAIDVIVSEIAVTNHLWSLQGMVDTLIFLCLVGVSLQVWIIWNSFYRRKPQVNENEYDHR